MSFQKGLRLKHIMHISFGIILKYYSQGLSLLGSTLSPFFPPPAPNSLPTLWMLGPPSLIHRGRSAPGGAYILLIILHIYTSTSAGSWPNKHISLPIIQNLAHQPIKHNYNSFQNMVYNGARPWGHYNFPREYNH
jgi:hypothetical protein